MENEKQEETTKTQQELVKEEKKLKALKEKAIELGVNFEEGVTYDELAPLVKAAKKEQDKQSSSSTVEAGVEGEGVFEDGIRVKAILQDGRETATHYHCAMENGTTMHVPKSKFKVS